MLRVYLTGPVSLSRGETTLGESALAGRLGRTVLVRLALESHPIDRARLVDDLWSGQPPRGSESMLNATFSRLRSALTTLDLDARKVLQSSGGVAGFLPPVGTRIDVAVATRSIDAAEGAFRRNDLDAAWSAATVAHSVARRPLLPGVDLVWLDAERERLHQVLERSLTVLSDVWLKRGDPQQSATMAKELVRCAPYSESAHHRLVRALVALGDRSETARAIKRWNTVLTDELGLPADEELRLPELARARPPGRVSPVPDSAASNGPITASGMSTGWADAEPLTGVLGRACERSVVDELLASLAGGDGGCVVLVGEAGIGKTTLARLAAASASARGIRTLVTAGVPLTLGRPLQPVLDALDRLEGGGSADHRDVSTRTLLEATVGDPVTLLLQRVIDRLDTVAADEPLLLVLEDLHWVDEATLTLVHHHLTRRDRRRLAIVATSRPPVPGTPLDRLLTVATGSTALVVGGLDPTAVDALVTASIGSRRVELDQNVLEAAAGNPLLIDAVVRRHLARADVADQQPADDQPGVDGDPVAAIVRSLAPDVVVLLQMAAVAGDDLRVDLLTAGTDLTVTEVLTRLERARAAGVVDVADDRYVFRHALYRAAVLGALPAAARAALHLEIARVLGRIGAPTLEIAEHVAQGARRGDRVAVEQLTSAAEELADTDPSTALRITDLALGLVGATEVPLPLRVVRVACLAACGRAAEADELGSGLLRAGVPAAVEAEVRRELALAAFVSGRIADADQHMARVVELAADSEAAARAVTEQAWARMLALDGAGAWTATWQGVSDGDASTRIAAESLRCWLGLWRLDTASAAAAADHLEAAVGLRPRGDWQIFQPLLGAAAVRLEQERYEQALADAVAGRRLAHDAGSVWATAAYDTLTASVEFRRGHFDAAASAALEALDGTAIVDSFGVEIWSRALLAQVALRRGDVEVGRHHVEAALLASEDGRAQLGIDQLVIAQAQLHLADGDRSAAISTLDDGWLFLGAVGIGFVRGIVGVELVKQLCLAGERADHADAVAATIDDHARTSGLALLTAAATRAQAWMHRTPERVDTAIDAAIASRNLVARVDALADGLAIAPAHPSAQRWAVDLATLLDRMGAQPVPETKRAKARVERPRFGPDALTAAERRVALLVAEGLTNAKIAARLVLSRRTVDTQVLAAYRKLGVSSRVGLTRALLDDAAG